MQAVRRSFNAFIVFAVHALVSDAVGAQAVGTRADTLGRGRAIFESTCRSCHTVTPPVQGAPAMSRIAQHYVQRLGSRRAATQRLAEWLSAPAAERSLLPRDAVARFGVMPHLPLADAGRFAVAAYVVTLGDSAPGRGRRRARR